MKPAQIAKALVGGLVAFVGAGATAAADGAIDTGEWWGMAATALGAGYAVWQTPNADDDDDDQGGRHRVDDSLPDRV